MDLRKIDPKEYITVDLGQDIILGWLHDAEAGWMHNGDPKMPHAELASGMCSNGFFFCRKLLKYPNINEILAFQLAKKLAAALFVSHVGAVTGRLVDAVVGSPYSALTFSYMVAHIFCVQHGIPEKDQSDPKGKKMTWKEEFPAGTRILRVEELVTTMGTTDEVTRAIQQINPYPVTFLPVIGVLVHRPPTLPIYYWNKRIVALVEREIWAVPPEQCELCKAGSPRVKPKANWARLVGKGGF